MFDTFLSARWENLIMANYAVPPTVLQPYLPNGVELDLFEGKAYVSLVGFMFINTRLFKIPIPFLGTFEEINLRFYVKRTIRKEIKRGVVFINETVPYRMVAWLANKLYKEHYIAIPTKNTITSNEQLKTIKYQWKIANEWNDIFVNAVNEKQTMAIDSMEAFIFEHYYGYIKINAFNTQEYEVKHPSWQVNRVIDYAVHCDFAKMYGEDFSFLSKQEPDTVFLAAGSAVSVKWKRTRF